MNTASLADIFIRDRYRKKEAYKNLALVSRENVKRKKLKENIKHKNGGTIKVCKYPESMWPKVVVSSNQNNKSRHIVEERQKQNYIKRRGRKKEKKRKEKEKM